MQGTVKPGSVALDGAKAKFQEWRDAEKDLAAAKTTADRLRNEFRATMAALGAQEGTIGGTPVLTNRKTATFRSTQFSTERPDLAEQYTRGMWKRELDLKALKEEMPEIYDEYLAQALRPNFKAFDATTAGSNE